MDLEGSGDGVGSCRPDLLQHLLEPLFTEDVTAHTLFALLYLLGLGLLRRASTIGKLSEDSASVGFSGIKMVKADCSQVV